MIAPQILEDEEDLYYSDEDSENEDLSEQNCALSRRKLNKNQTQETN